MSGEASGSSSLTEEAHDKAPSIKERLEAQRQQIWRVMSIIEACRMGSDSMIVTMQGDEEPDFEGALAAAYRLLEEVSGELETIGGVDQSTS